MLQDVLLKLLIPAFVPHKLVLSKLVQFHELRIRFALARHTLEVIKGACELVYGTL